jgi:hypothetical protein
MKKFTFTWKETTIKTVDVPFNDMAGSEVWYQPSDSEGIIVNRGGKLFIEWSDADDTDLQTEHGLSILRECKIF